MNEHIEREVNANLSRKKRNSLILSLVLVALIVVIVALNYSSFSSILTGKSIEEINQESLAAEPENADVVLVDSRVLGKINELNSGGNNEQ